MATPVNCTTSVKFESNALINSGNIGAMHNGPSAWLNVTAVEQTMVDIFQKRLQFNGSRGSCDGWGTRMWSDLDLE